MLSSNAPNGFQAAKKRGRRLEQFLVNVHQVEKYKTRNLDLKRTLKKVAN